MNAPRRSLALGVAVLACAGCGGVGLWSAPHEGGSSSGSTSTGSSGTTPSSGGSATTSSGNTSGGTSSTSSGTSSTTGTSSGTSSTTGTSSGTTTGSCAGQQAPALHCARADGSTTWFVIGDAPVITCTVDPGPAPTSWSGSTDPAYFTVDARSAPQAVYVGLPATHVPIGFGDTQVAVTVTATFCPGVSSSDVVHLPVVGNILAADHWEGNIKAFTSGGDSLGLFSASLSLGKVSLVATLDNGHILAGSATRLAELDRSGLLVQDFDLTDHNSQPLFPDCGSGCTTEPWGAAQASDGTIWVSASRSRDSNGDLYQFSASGQYQATIAPPSGATPTYWMPMGIARRGDGAMLVTSGDEHDPAFVGVYPPGSTPGTYAQAQAQTCTGLSDGGAYACATQSYNQMGLSGGWVDPDGTLFVSNIWDDDNDADVLAFDATTFQFKRASAHYTDVLDPMYNEWLRGITRAGDRLLVAVWNGCIWGLDPKSLMPLPPGRGIDARGCNASYSNADFHAVAHLGPNP